MEVSMNNNKSFYSFFLYLLCILIPCNASTNLSAVELFEKGVKEQNNENWYMASQYFMETVQANPVYAQAWYELSFCSYQLGEYDLALSYLDNAEKYAQNDTKIKNLRGMCYIALGDFSKAKEVFENILKMYPNDINAHFGLAELDLFAGKISGAQSQYNEALKREISNRKALLSMAIISGQLGNFEDAESYIKKALKYYSGESEVHYFAAVLYVMKGDYKAAEKRARIAIEINPNYDKAYELLAKILYVQGEYSEVVDICDYRISRDRKLGSAWYLKGCAQLKQNLSEDAINTWSVGLEITPTDEIMRAALELEVNKVLPIEDARRKTWALYHVKTANEYTRRFDSPSTTYEYQRALKIDPSNSEARLSFANMLKLNELNELYLEQLRFVQQMSDDEKANSVEISDTIEAYDSLLKNTLSQKWNVQPFYLDKTRWHIGIFYTETLPSALHVESNRVSAEFASDIFAGVVDTSISTVVDKVSGFGNAYQNARLNKLDYFLIISVDEGKRDFTLKATMYSGRTGTKLDEFFFYGTGNNRYSNVFRRFRAKILECLHIKGKILDREGKTVLIDLGKSEHIVDGAVFDIVRKDCISTASSEFGVVYNKNDVLGSVTITNTSEEISEGLLSYKGFYDRINAEDEVVLISLPKDEQKNPSEDIGLTDVTPAADSNGNPVSKKELGLTAEDLGVRRIPSFIELIRSIY